MRIAGDIFNILLFLTAVGGGFTVLSLLADRAPRFAPPLWFGVCGMAAYMVPLLAPGLYLVPREAHAWREGYSAVCAVWLCGAAFFALYNVVRTLLARRALRSYPVCGDERVTAIGTRCCKLVGLKKVPLVRFGTLDGPACAAGVFRPTVILNEAVIKRLSDKELAAVLCHEMTHIRRGHILLGRVYDWVCVLHWFNPLAWIARKEFAAQCELDCDRGALASLENEVTGGEYAGAMLRLLELTALPGGGKGPGPGATGFLLTKRRVAQIMTKPSKAKTAIMTAVLAALLVAVMLLSAALSRGYFYPYPAYSRGTEYSYAVEAYFFALQIYKCSLTEGDKMQNIEIDHLTKRYKNGVTALDDISFTAGGGVFGLLGHNGAGKTTLMKALATVLEPSAGTIRVCGYDTRKQGKQVRGLIGYLPQELAMHPSLSVFDFVNYMAELKGVRDKNAVHAVLEQVEMLAFAKRKIGQLSGGMKRRVGIAQALVGDPRILVVDEPTAGLDPEERVRFRGVLSRFARDGRTVLLSTHIVEDVYQVCEELAVLRKGRLFYAGTPAALMARVEGKVKMIHLEREEQLPELQKQAVVLSVTYEDSGPSARVMDERGLFPQAAVAATLEDAYVYCMGGKAHG